MSPLVPDVKVRTCLWFDGNGEEAAQFYVSLLPDSAITGLHRADPDAPALIIDFTLAGAPYQILNGGPYYRLTPAVSISVQTDDQAETDRLWSALTAQGGVESRCGWLSDRFGLSWQIVPRALTEMLMDPDREAAARVHAAMTEMVKFDLPVLQKAFRGA
ncbi:VOC family protein [Chachezhania sediminis]|uniref:VOC family protein n=1 Tax=Chachezhania sediminis TaxID=2599291 RepID=UPI00131E9328|nr:VOC family protein [Chachezhania sediminis]